MAESSKKLAVVDVLGASLAYPWTHKGEMLKVFLVPGILLYGPLVYLAWTAFVAGGGVPFEPIIINTEATDGGAVISATKSLVKCEAMANLIQLVGIVFTALVGVPITWAIVEGRRPGFIRLDRYTLVYFIGQFLMPILYILLALAIGGVTALLIVLTNLVIETPGIAVLIGMTGFFTVMFFWIRLSLYLPQLAMTADINPNIGYRMTKGNVWRIVGLYLLSFIVLVGIMIISFFFFALMFMAITGLDFDGLIQAMETEDLEGVSAWITQTFWGPQGLAFAVPYLVLAIYLTGFSLALPAYMYRDLQEN